MLMRSMLIMPAFPASSLLQHLHRHIMASPSLVLQALLARGTTHANQKTMSMRESLQRNALHSLNRALEPHLGLSTALSLDAQTLAMLTAARAISSSLLLEETFGHPSVSFMAPEDQQHLIRALMEGYASLPPSIPGASP
jgi:hypothetical protein